MENIAILGATGSIGTSALDVIAQYPDRYHVSVLCANTNVKKLAQLASVWQPELVAVARDELYKPLLEELAQLGVTHVSVASGTEALRAVAGDPEVDTVIQAVVGSAGVVPSFAAVGAGKRVLMANKESVVCGGDMLMTLARRTGAKILPVDSEHNAIFQCLHAGNEQDAQTAKLWLTCSGGPFHSRPEIDLESVSPEMALAHPTWSMGRKITIDSATLMNKGLEVIEAHHLFNKSVDDIGVVIHPQSIVHSMVEFADGAVIAQLGTPSMKTPIAYCLGYPQRIQGSSKRLSLPEIGRLDFSTPDMKRFPQLAYAYEAARRGQKAAVVLNAANEAGVAAFLESRAGFVDIARVCRAMLDAYDDAPLAGVPDIAALDAEVRARAQQWLEKNRGQSAAC